MVVVVAAAAPMAVGGRLASQQRHQQQHQISSRVMGNGRMRRRRRNDGNAAPSAPPLLVVQCKKKGGGGGGGGGKKGGGRLAREPKAKNGRLGTKAALLQAEAVPGEATFARISEDDEAFGPPAILVIGFSPEETRHVRELMHDLDAEFVTVRSLQSPMLDMTLFEAITVPLEPDSEEEQRSLNLNFPRMFIMSGLNGSETIQLMFEVYELGVEPPIFAALVPRNADTKLSALLGDIQDDHFRLNPKSAGVNKQLVRLKNK